MKRIQIAVIITFIIIGLFASNAEGFGKYQNHPKDGHFKQIPSSVDYWYFFDAQKWYIKAPDKFQHMMGSFALTKVSDMFMDKYLAGGLVLGLGIYKEYDDAMREGWSPRDLLMDTIGVVAGLANSEKYKIWMDWVDEAIILKFTISFH